MIETALFGHLSTFPGLVALVGTRVYPMRLPQGATLPAVVYQKVSGPRIYAMGNTNQGGRPRFQFTCWGSTYLGAKAVAGQVQAALDGLTGTIGGVTVRMVTQENELDHHDDETDRYAVILDFIVHHEGA